MYFLIDIRLKLIEPIETHIWQMLVFCILVSVFFKCQACGAVPLVENAEGPLNIPRANQGLQGANGNQWITTYGNPLFRRYHGPGTDFAVRGYPPHFSQQGNALNNENTEVKISCIS